MAFWIDFLSGGDKLQKILAKKPLLRSIESLGKQGDYYAYKVEADATTLLDFLDHAAREYTGSGLAQSTRDTMVEDMGTGALIS